MNKKGVSTGFEALMWLPRGIFVVAIALIIIFVFGSFITTTIDVKKVHSLLLANHFFYDKNGLAFFDEEIGRVYPGKIDLDVFSVEKIVMNNPQLLAAKIVYEGKNEIFYKKELYERLFPRRGFGGPGGSQEFLIVKTAVNKAVFESGSIFFSILIPNNVK